MPKVARKRKYSLRKFGKYVKTAKRVWRVANQLGSVIARQRTGPATGRSPALHASMARRLSDSSSSSNSSRDSKTMYEKFVSTGDGMTTSKFKYNYKAMKGWTTAKKTSKTDIYRINFSGSVASTYGQQGVNTCSYANRAGDITATYLFSNQSNGQQAVLGAITANDKDKLLWIDSVEEEIIFNNHSSGCMLFKIFDLVCANDLVGAPESCWSIGLQNTAGLTPAEETAIYWPSHPSDSVTFKRSWKILKQTDVELHTGRAHRHLRYISYKGRLPMEKAYDSAATVNFKGITHAVMIVQYGMPTSNVAAGTAATVVTVDKTKTCWVGNRIVKSRLTTVKGKHLEYIDTMNKAPSNAYQQQGDASGIFDSQTNTINIASAFS